MDGAERCRRLPIGAEPLPEGGVHFRVWAPRRKNVAVVLESGSGVTGATSQATGLSPEPGGYFSGSVPSASTGTLYRYRLDDGDYLYPDPASRYQPEGPHGPSQVIDPRQFRWTDTDWPGVRLDGQVFYEMHIGTFAREGTWESATREFAELAALGVTAVEVMPVAEFPGRFGWGYDGVDLFAPTRLYGEPDDFRRFVDRAHAAGLGVILDVVYNHLGPDGNYLKQFSDDYFTDRHPNEWGEAINFDGDNSGPVREFFVANAGYWIDEFHVDGLRLDATHAIHDVSPEHVLAAISRQTRSVAGPARSVLLIAESDSQDARLARPFERGGYGLDAVWNDDFHHSAMVATTGRREGYYARYHGTPQELVSAAKWGYIYQGQHNSAPLKRRGTPAFDLRPESFVTFIQNHDHIANAAHGHRAHMLTSPGRHRAMTGLFLLAPGTPLIFQGQEFSSSSPFLFFADHGEELARLVRKGRGDFLARFRSLAGAEIQALLADPSDPSVFERSKLDLSERDINHGAYSLHRDLLSLRRQDPVFSARRPGGVDGAVLGPEAFVLRFFGDGGEDRLLLVNFGRDVSLDWAPEPLLASPLGKRWAVLWSSENPRYGGAGTPPLETEEGWRIPGQAAVVLAPVEE